MPPTPTPTATPTTGHLVDLLGVVTNHHAATRVGMQGHLADAMALDTRFEKQKLGSIIAVCDLEAKHLEEREASLRALADEVAAQRKAVAAQKQILEARLVELDQARFPRA